MLQKHQLATVSPQSNYAKCDPINIPPGSQYSATHAKCYRHVCTVSVLQEEVVALGTCQQGQAYQYKT